jgi:hypothetical protein
VETEVRPLLGNVPSFYAIHGLRRQLKGYEGKLRVKVAKEPIRRYEGTQRKSAIRIAC